MENSVQNTGMNKLLLAVVLLLFCLGVAVVYSASAPYAVSNNKPAEYYMMAHLKKVGLGIGGMLFIAKFFDYGWWKLAGRVLFVVAAALTFATIGGDEVKGASRWIWGIQPSEFMKLGLIIFVCIKLSEAGDRIKSFACSVVQPGIPYLIAAVALLLQPNFSMFSLISFIVVCIMMVAGVNMKYLGIAGLVAVPAAIIKFLTSTHSRARIMAFFDSGENTMAASKYQGSVALEALGNGGWTGTGFGEGVQKMGYLPEAHKDVVYSVIGEEFGFIGTLIILILFAILFSQGFKIARNSNTRFGKLLAFGLTISLFCNFAIHVCVCVGLAPTTGQPLPFFSFGGTNLIYTSIAIGILLNISKSDTGRKIREPLVNGSSLESGAYRNFGFTRSGV